MDLAPLQFTQNLNLFSPPPALPAAGPAMDEAKIAEAAREFEAMFMAEMLKPMFETVGVNKMFGGGKGEEVFRSFLVQEYGQILSRTGTIGIAEQVKEQLLAMQEAANKGPLA